MFLGKFDQRLLTSFLGTDLVIISVHVVLGLGMLLGWMTVWPDFLNITRDWSAAEIFGYFKWCLVIFTLIAVFMSKRVPVFLGLALFFAIALLDDSLQLHERGGHLLSRSLPLYDIFGSKQSMVGELLIWAIIGLLAAICLAIGWVKSGAEARRQVIPVLLLFLGVVFCAIFLDVLHHAVSEEGSALGGALGILEDGGEAITMTFLACYVRGQYRHW